MEHFAHIQGCQCQEGTRGSFQAIMEMLEVSTSYWNHIDEMYSDVKQGHDKLIDKLDQCIKNLVKKCQYTEAEKLVRRTELFISCNQALQGEEVGLIKEKVRRHNVHSTTSVSQGTRDEGERF